MKRPETPSEKLRLTANIFWTLGCVLTTNFIFSANEIANWWMYPLILIVCVLVQYGMTNVESALFSGSIPPPWSKRRTTQTNWIWAGAATILSIDVFLNLGGVGTIAKFVRNSSSGDVLKSDFGASDLGINLVAAFFILAVSLFIAIGPELARLHAGILEKSLEFGESKAVTAFQSEPERTPERVSSQMSDLDAVLQAARLKTLPTRTEIGLPTRRNS